MVSISVSAIMEFKFTIMYSRMKDKKVGEGTYAVVYKGMLQFAAIFKFGTIIETRARGVYGQTSRYKEDQSRTVQGWP